MHELDMILIDTETLITYGREVKRRLPYFQYRTLVIHCSSLTSFFEYVDWKEHCQHIGHVHGLGDA
ncbi:MAG: hypothetical protein M3214_11770 [Actinomycetota bacterium]|nr:hypothetical protein [Actinomycetota bacterium]